MTAKTRHWCRRWDSNPQGRKDRGILSALRMPVPPLRRAGGRTYHDEGSAPPRVCRNQVRRERAPDHSLQPKGAAIGCATRRGCSSVGRALEWHSRGRGFDSPQLHHGIRRSLRANLRALHFISGLSATYLGYRPPTRCHGGMCLVQSADRPASAEGPRGSRSRGRSESRDVPDVPPETPLPGRQALRPRRLIPDRLN